MSLSNIIFDMTETAHSTHEFVKQKEVRNFLFSAMVSYNIVVGDTVTKVIVRLTGIDKTSPFAKRQFIVLIASLFITIPLCLYRDVARLAKVSFLSLVCIVFILFSIFLRIGPISDIV